MTTNEFISHCQYLCDLKPTVYRMADLRYWPESRLAEALADEAMEEDGPENISP